MLKLSYSKINFSAGVDYLKNALETAKMFQEARLDNSEFVAICQLILLRTGESSFSVNLLLLDTTKFVVKLIGLSHTISIVVTCFMGF